MKIILITLIFFVTVSVYFLMSKDDVISSVEMSSTNSNYKTSSPFDIIEENQVENLSENESELFDPVVAAKVTLLIKEDNIQKLYEKVFEIEDEIVRGEVISEIYDRVFDSNENFSEMMIGFIQAGFNIEQVLSYTGILSYEEFNILYASVQDILTEDQKIQFLEEYAKSASLSQDEFVPDLLINDMTKYGIEVDQNFFYDTLVLDPTEEFINYYKDKPHVYERFLKIPQSDQKSDLIGWWLAFKTIYANTPQEIELMEKLRYAENKDYSWLINMSMDELNKAYMDTFDERMFQ